jgi:hypothetical protein
MILLSCPATRQEAWGKVVGEGDSLLEVFDKTGWAPVNISWEQLWELRDTKQNKTISKDEYENIVRKLKGWEVEA